MPHKIDLLLPRNTKVPNHLAIIPDGNRRWARSRGLYTLQGHKKGFDRAVELGRVARKWGIHTVTLWGFSTENWDRTEEEISYLMRLYHKLIDDYLAEAMENNVRIYHLGRKDRLPKSLIKKIKQAEEKTKNNKKYIMNIALDHGGHDDIVRATQAMIKDGVKADKVTKELFESYLDTKGQPYPYIDLLIRTSGEQRVSGFMMWQAEYAEMYWESGHFPDFTPEKMKEAILDYSRRRRRFGGNDALEHFTFKPQMVAKLEVDWWRLANIPEGTAFMDYSMQHLREQFGLSKSLAKEAAHYIGEALKQGDARKWDKARVKASKFYKLIKDELKLAFEPKIVASLQVQFWQDVSGKDSVQAASEAEESAKELYAETYRISLLQAAKLAHLRVMANIERNLAMQNEGSEHWEKAEDYLNKFYSALKDRIA